MPPTRDNRPPNPSPTELHAVHTVHAVHTARSSRRILLAIILLAVLLRVAVALYLGDTTPPAKDETSYSTLALRLATGHGYSFPVAWYPFAPADAPTSHWSFLYTAFLAVVYRVVSLLTGAPVAAGATVVATVVSHPLAARLLQALITGILMPLLTYRLSARLFAGALPIARDEAAGRGDTRSFIRGPIRGWPLPHLAALLSALLAALYAYFILFDVMVQTEAFFICAVLWSLDLALSLLPPTPSTGPALAGTSTNASAAGASTNARAGGASTGPALAGTSTNARAAGTSTPAALIFGLSLGIATLLRQSILPWIAVMLIYLLIVRWRANRWKLANLWRVAAPLVLAGAVLIACIAPFTIRNYRVYGQFLLLNSNAGYAMYSAQHPLHGTDFQAYAAAPLPADLVNQGLNEAQWDKALMARGIGFVLADPGRYLLLSLSRVADYFEFWPTADSSPLFNAGRLLSFTVLLPFMLAGIVLAARRYKWQPALIYLFMAVYSVLHIFTWAMSRYRLPVDAVALPFAALVLVELWHWLRIRRPKLITGREKA